MKYKIDFVYHYTTMTAWASILRSGFLKSRSLLIRETLEAAREDWQELKQNREALMQVLPPYLTASHSPLRRKSMVFFGIHPYFEAQAGYLTEVKMPNCPWSRREDGQEEFLVVGMRRLFERGGGLVRLGMWSNMFPTWERLLDDAGVGWFEKMEMRCIDEGNDFYNRDHVTGIVADKIPLKAIRRVELCVPSPDGSACVWIPFLFPAQNSTIDVDDTDRIMLSMKSLAIAQMDALIARGKNIAVEVGHLPEWGPWDFSLDELHLCLSDPNKCETVVGHAP